MKLIKQGTEKKDCQRKKYQRKRINSQNTEFKLVPLLRKVSCDPATSNASNGFTSALKMRNEEKKREADPLPVF